MTRPRTALLSLALLGGCASQPPLQQAAAVDLDRYMGTWYVIAHVPYFAERGDVATADEYRRRPDGTMAVTYHTARASTPRKRPGPARRGCRFRPIRRTGKCSWSGRSAPTT